MLNTALLKSNSPLLSVRPRIDEGLLSHIVDRSRSGLIDTVVVEGRPGAGKTDLTDSLCTGLFRRSLAHRRVGMDEEVIPRSQRDGKEIVQYHPGDLIREVLSARRKGAQLDYQRYNSATGESDLPTKLIVPPADSALLVIEGITSTETVRQFVGNFRSEISDRILYIILKEDPRVANWRREKRDIEEKGLPPDFVRQRIRSQEGSIQAYYRDLMGDLFSLNNLRTKSNSMQVF